MSDTFDPVRSFCDAASEAVKTIAQETIREQLTRAEFSSVFVVAKEEMAAIIAGHITLPVIYTFLNLVDPTRQQLEAILREPLQAGVQLARQALSMNSQNDADMRLKEELFVATIESFEKAHLYAGTRKNTDEAYRIRFIQALFAKQMGSASAQVYFAHIRERLETEHNQLSSKISFLESRFSKLVPSISQETWRDVRECLVLLLRTDPNKIKHPITEESVGNYLEKHLKSKRNITEDLRRSIVQLSHAELFIRLAKLRMTRIEAVRRFFRT